MFTQDWCNVENVGRTVTSMQTAVLVAWRSWQEEASAADGTVIRSRLVVSHRLSSVKSALSRIMCHFTLKL
ncbi:hypothetical protein ACOMHN_015420 [Nucella lapillus]